MYQFTFIWKELKYITNDFILEQKDSIQDGLNDSEFAIVEKDYKVILPKEVIHWFKEANGQIRPNPFWKTGLYWYSLVECLGKQKEFKRSDLYPLAEDKDGNVYSAYKIEKQNQWQITVNQKEILKKTWVEWGEEQFAILVKENVLPLLISKEREDRIRFSKYARWTTYGLRIEKIIKEEWQRVLNQDILKLEYWRQAESEAYLSLRRASVPQELEIVKTLLDQFSPKDASPPPPSFWLGFAVIANKPNHYYCKNWLEDWFSLLYKNNSIIQNWLSSKNLDLVAFLTFSKRKPIQKKALDLISKDKNGYEAIWASIRRLGHKIKQEDLERVAKYFLENDSDVLNRARIWLEDSHDSIITLASIILLKNDKKDFIEISKAKGSIQAAKILAQYNLSFAEWKDFLGNANYVYHWLEAIRDLVQENPEIVKVFSKESWITQLAELIEGLKLSHSDRHRILGLIKDFPFKENDPAILKLTLPLFPPEAKDLYLEDKSELALYYLSCYYTYASETEKKQIQIAEESFKKITCAHCGHSFQWNSYYTTPNVSCPKCKDTILESGIGVYFYIGNHARLNAFKYKPRLKQAPYNPVED